jgi:betaine-aldehyde dehydrogenase
MTQDKLYINGEFRATAGSAQVIDPSTGQPLRAVPLASRQDIVDAVDAARAAFDNGPWPGLPLGRRKEFLTLISQGILDEAAALASLETANTGKPIKESTFMDVPSAARVFEHYAARLEEYLQECVVTTQDPFPSRSVLSREPLGVVGVIVPWNYPLLIACWKIAAALAAGNTVVVKPSTITPLTALALGRIIHKAGLPKGVVNIVNASGIDAGECLVSSNKVDMISFTGSNEVGRQIVSSTASRVKKLLLELGGKSASIITRDADVETAVNGTLCSCFLNQGQMCTAMSRVYVADVVYEQFVSSFVGKANRIRLGPGSDFETQMGPLISAEHLKDVHASVQEARDEGARVLCGGLPAVEPALRTGFFYPPTVLEGVTPRMSLFRREVFGPVVSVHRFSDESEAVAMANDSDFGLAACVWSGDAAGAKGIARRLNAGIVWVNTYGMFLNELPYGGFKQSGFGKELGREGLWEYTRLKNMVVDASTDKPLVHYWYGF